MASLEFLLTSVQKNQNWAKFFVKGLEDYQIEDSNVSRHYKPWERYTNYIAYDMPDNIIFTVYTQSGNKNGSQDFRFYICKTITDNPNSITGAGWIEGDFVIIAEGLKKVFAPRLMNWWNNSKDHSLKFAYHCSRHIGKRGIKELPPMI